MRASDVAGLRRVGRCEGFGFGQWVCVAFGDQVSSKDDEQVGCMVK